MRRNKPGLFLELGIRRARAEVFHDIVVSTRVKIKRGRHCRLAGLSWPVYTKYTNKALEMGLIEKTTTQRGELHYRKRPEPAYLATEKGLAWAKVFWDASKPLYGIEE